MRQHRSTPTCKKKQKETRREAGHHTICERDRLCITAGTEGKGNNDGGKGKLRTREAAITWSALRARDARNKGPRRTTRGLPRSATGDTSSCSSAGLGALRLPARQALQSSSRLLPRERHSAAHVLQCHAWRGGMNVSRRARMLAETTAL